MTFSLEDLQGRQGVYTIWIKECAYVGSAVNIGRRIRRHIRDLCQGEHRNKFFQRAYDKYGDEAVRIGEIKFCDGYSEQELKKFELIVQDRLRNDGVELFSVVEPDGNPMVGEGSEEARRKVGEATRRRWEDPEYRKLMTEAAKGENNPFFGQKHSDETKRKQSERMKGNQYSLGYKHSEETKQKMSEAAKNRPPMAEETRKKLSDAGKGRKHSNETKQKISKALKGKPRKKRKTGRLEKGNDDG